MTLTAELSLYPLSDDYLTVIGAFIDGLNGRDDIVVVTNAMSTQLRGEHDAVMAAVSDTLRESARRFGPQALVCKFLPMALDIA